MAMQWQHSSAMLWGENLPCHQTFIKYTRNSFIHLYKIIRNSVRLGCICSNQMLNFEA